MKNNIQEKQYLELCDACDEVLKSSGTIKECVAIGWLHIIRAHPEYLRKYVSEFEYSNYFIRKARKLSKYILIYIHWFNQLRKTIFSDGLPWKSSGEKLGESDLLFVSHLINKSSIKQKDDFYFGKMPEIFRMSGYSVLTAMIDQTKYTRENTTLKRNMTYPTVIIFSSVLSFVNEIKLFLRLQAERIRLSRLAKLENKGLLKNVLIRASQEAISPETVGNLRFMFQINLLVKKIKPKVIIVTYEGYAWERLVFMAAHKIDPNIRCVGYQHSAIYFLQHALKRSLSDMLDPDIILTTSKTLKRKLDDNNKLNNDIEVQVLGSTRIQKTNNKIPRNAHVKNKKMCMVIPEGWISECNIMFNFSLLCAYQFPNINFIWRLHPLISFEKLKKNNKSFKNLPDNVIMSQHDIQYDIERSDWALYRGSTAIIQATKQEVRPIYLQLDGEITVDPLYEIEKWKAVISTVKDFGEIINMDPKDVKTRTERQNAIDSCIKLITPIDYDVIKNIVNKIINH